MKIQTKLYLFGLVIALAILIVCSIADFEDLITSNQYFIVAFGTLAAFNVFNAMIRLKENTILKKNRIILTSVLLVGIGIAITIFSLINLDFNYEFVFVVAIILGSLLIPLADWNAKRTESKKAIN